MEVVLARLEMNRQGASPGETTDHGQPATDQYAFSIFSKVNIFEGYIWLHMSRIIVFSKLQVAVAQSESLVDRNAVRRSASFWLISLSNRTQFQ